MGILESITHKEESQNLIDDAQRIYDDTKRNFENQKKQTTKALESLGKVKAWSGGMDSFGAFNQAYRHR